jgi:hypothetical protein
MSDFASAILSTPDAAQPSNMRMSAIPDVAITDFNATAPLQPGHPTAAQFGVGQLGVGQFGTQAPNRPAASFSPALELVQTAASAGVAAPSGPVSKDGSATTTEGLTAAPAHTQLEAETTAPGTRRSKTGVILGMVAAGMAALAAGVFVFLSPGNADSETSPETPVNAQAAELPAKPEPELVPPPGATSKANEPEPPNKITLKVETDPPGALLSKNGFQICDVTPCEVLADLNDQMELEAKKGNMKGTAKVLAQSDQTVTIRLVAPAAPKPKPKPGTLCEVEVDGLKILRPCK